MIVRVQILALICLLFSSCRDQSPSNYIVQGIITSSLDNMPCEGFNVEFEQQVIEGGSFNGYFETAATTTTDAEGFYRMEFPRKSAVYFRLRVENDGWFPILEDINPEDIEPNVAFDFDVITTPRADLVIRVKNSPPTTDEDKLRMRLLKNLDLSTCDTEWRVFNGANIDSTWNCIVHGNVWMPYLSIDQTDPEIEITSLDSVFCTAFETTEINLFY